MRYNIKVIKSKWFLKKKNTFINTPKKFLNNTFMKIKVEKFDSMLIIHTYNNILIRIILKTDINRLDLTSLPKIFYKNVKLSL